MPAGTKRPRKPDLTDEAFHEEDDYVLVLDDFRSRFGTP